jgi:hypothetical protein
MVLNEAQGGKLANLRDRTEHEFKPSKSQCGTAG